MKVKKLFFLAVAVVFAAPSALHAQYYEIANQLPGLIQPVLSGSVNYKGFVEASYTQGLGKYKANFLELSTSQGFRYSNWFYMGVGIGVDFLFSNINDNWGESWDNNSDFDSQYSSRSNAVMIPLFTDFRFIIGDNQRLVSQGIYTRSPSMYIDVKVGCSFLCSNDYVRIDNGYLTNQQYFYLRPSIGVRIPVSTASSKQAVDIGVSYKLLTSNYWNSWERNITLSSLGASIAFEW